MVSNKMIVTFMLIAVTSLAAVGCSDDNPVTPNDIDTAPMIPPTDLEVEYVQGKAILNWEPTLDYRWEEYVIIRERNGDFVDLGFTDLDTYVDAQPVVGTSIYYVHALGRGNTSAPVSAYLTIQLARQPAKVAE